MCELVGGVLSQSSKFEGWGGGRGYEGINQSLIILGGGGG